MNFKKLARKDSRYASLLKLMEGVDREYTAEEQDAIRKAGDFWVSLGEDSQWYRYLCRDIFRMSPKEDVLSHDSAKLVLAAWLGWVTENCWGSNGVFWKDFAWPSDFLRKDLRRTIIKARIKDEHVILGRIKRADPFPVLPSDDKGVETDVFLYTDTEQKLQDGLSEFGVDLIEEFVDDVCQLYSWESSREYEAVRRWSVTAWENTAFSNPRKKWLADNMLSNLVKRGGLNFVPDCVDYQKQ